MANIGTSISPAPVITSYTKGGIVASGYTGNVTVSLGTNPTNATLGGTTTVAAVAGVATFSNLTLNRSGKDFTLQASGAAQAGVTPRAVTSQKFSIPTQLVFTIQPAFAEPGESIPTFQVTARDTAGNTDTAYTGDVTISIYRGAGNGILTGLFTTGAISGVASYAGLEIDTAGIYSFLAQGTEVTTAALPSPKVSNTFLIGNAFSLTAADFGDGLTFGFQSVSYVPPTVGVISPLTYLGGTIYRISGKPSTEQVIVTINGTFTQDAFTSITVGAVTLLTANVNSFSSGSVTTWTWQDATAATLIPSAGSYTAVFI